MTVVATGLGDVLSPKTVVDNGQLNNEAREAFNSADAPQILRHRR